MTFDRLQKILDTVLNGNPNNTFIANEGLSQLGGILFYPKANQIEQSKKIHELLQTRFENQTQIILDKLRAYHFSSYYTPKAIIDFQIDLFKKNNFNPKTILEPSAGNGAYVKALTTAYKNAKIVALEPDILSFAILESNFKNNPNVQTINSTFEDYYLEKQKDKQKFDLVISNIPFGNFKIKNAFNHDLQSDKDRVVNNFFNTKADQLTNQGGITALLTSRSFLDNPGLYSQRETVLKTNNLIGAVRFNNTLFKDEKTAVVTDLMLYQKNNLKTNTTPLEDTFINTTVIAVENENFTINSYINNDQNLSNGTYAKGFFNQKPALTLNISEESLTSFTNKHLETLYIDTRLNPLTTSLDNPKVSNQPIINKEKKQTLESSIVNPDVHILDNQNETKSELIINSLKTESTISSQTKKAITKDDDAYLRNYTSLKTKGFIIEDQLPVYLENLSKTRVEKKYQELIKSYINLKTDYIILKENSKLDLYSETKIKTAVDNLHYDISMFQLYHGELSENFANLATDPEYNALRNYVIETYTADLNNGTNLKATSYFIALKNQDAIDNLYISSTQKTPNQDLQNLPSQSDNIAQTLNINSNKSVRDNFKILFSETGKIDLKTLAQVHNKTENELLEIGLKEKLFFLNPVYNSQNAFTNYEFTLYHNFISGDIASKIDTIKTIGLPNDLDPTDALNILEENRPKLVDIKDITFNFESPFIEDDAKADFFVRHLHEDIKIIKPNSESTIRLDYAKPHNDIAYKLYTTTVKDVQLYSYKKLLKNFVNNTIPVVTQSIKNADGTTTTFVHKDGTIQAQNKIQLLNQEFQIFITTSAKHKHNTEQNYYKLLLKDKNIEVAISNNPLIMPKTLIHEPYDHQKNGLLYGITRGTGLYDHKVGHGKTVSMGLLSHFMLKHKKAERVFIMTLKSTSHNFFKEIQTNFPGIGMLRLSEKNFNKHKRLETLNYIKDNPQIKIIVGEQTYLQSIPKEDRYVNNIRYDKLKMIDLDLEEARNRGVKDSKKIIDGLVKRRDNLEEQLGAKLDRFNNKWIVARSPTLTELNIGALIIDEAHEFKNIGYTTRHNRVSGLNDNQEKGKNLDLEISINSIHERMGKDKNIYFFTGTPLKNSVTEVYALQRYLVPNELKEKNIHNFDSWAAVFLKQSVEVESDILGHTKEKLRFRYFTNLPELSKSYNSFTHISDDKNFKPININVKKEFVTLERTENYKKLSEVTSDFTRNNDQNALFGKEKYSDPKANHVVALTLNRQGLVDPMLIDTSIPFTSEDRIKIHAVAKDTNELYHKTNEDKGVILIFSDYGTYKSNQYNSYDVIAETLNKVYDIPLHEIGYAQKENTQAKRKAFQENINTGKIRIAIGSTKTLGTGLNIQKKIVGILNVDIPYSPDAFDQRLGRGERVGNLLAQKYGHLVEKSYGIKDSTDIFSYSLNKHKQLFRDQVRVNDGTRTFDNGLTDFESLSYSQKESALIGDMDAFKLQQIESQLSLIVTQKELHQLSVKNADIQIDGYKDQNIKIESQIKKFKELEHITDKILIDPNALELSDTEIQNKIVANLNKYSNVRFADYNEINNFIKVSSQNIPDYKNSATIFNLRSDSPYNQAIFSVEKKYNSILEKTGYQYVLKYKEQRLSGKMQYKYDPKNLAQQPLKLLERVSKTILSKQTDIKDNIKSIALAEKIKFSPFDPEQQKKLDRLSLESKAIKKNRKL